MSDLEPDRVREEESYWPKVTDSQRQVLDELRSTFLDTGDWPTHAYLEQALEDKGIELDEELRGMPELTVYPDNRRMSGGVFFQEGDKIALMVRGLVACSEADREVEMLVATIKWAVAERRTVRQQPHEVTQKSWRAADAIAAMAEAIGGTNPPAYSAKLVLEVLRNEPTGDLPRWGGIPENFPNWQLDFPSSVKRFKDVQTIDDYLKETEPKPPPVFQMRTRTPLWPQATLEVPTDDHPIFGRATQRTDTFDCFVLMPLREPFQTVYETAVLPVAEELGVSCGHAMGILGPGRIMNDIYSAITFAEVVIAELTGGNRNVFYELGIAHEQRKQVVLLSQREEDVPFDVRDLRVVFYDWTDPERSAASLISRLRPNFEAALRAAREGA